MHKTATVLVLLMLTLSSLLTLPLCSAAAKPSIPEFTVKYVESSYDVPPNYSVDPYTGKNTTITDAHRAVGKSIQVSIKNQQYSYSYNGSDVWVAYNIRLKGHFEPNWTVLYTPNEFSSNGGLCPQSSSGNTDFTLPADYPVGGEVDFQVQAYGVYETQTLVYPHIGSTAGAYYINVYPVVESSGWSSTQTLTIGDGNVAAAQPTPDPTAISTSSTTAKPSVPEFKVEYSKSPDSIMVVITNQPFTPPNSSTNIYYNFKVKWHSVDAWNQLYYIQDNTNQLEVQSSSGYTNISFSPSRLGELNDKQVDIQVQAYIAVAHPTTPNGNIGYWTWEESGWSNTQTVTLPDDYLPPGSPTVIERFIVVCAVVGVVVAMLVIFLVFFRKLKRHRRVETEWREHGS